MLSLILSAVAHVPTYDGACDAVWCCTPPHHHDPSQVIYLRGSAASCTWRTSTSQAARSSTWTSSSATSPTTRRTRSTLGAAAAPRTRAPRAARARQRLPGRRARALYANGVPQHLQEGRPQVRHQPARRVHLQALYHPARGSTPTPATRIVWGPVIGLAEWFTFRELAEFPLFILANHGYAWNEMAYSWWLIVTVASSRGGCSSWPRTSTAAR